MEHNAFWVHFAEVHPRTEKYLVHSSEKYQMKDMADLSTCCRFVTTFPEGLPQGEMPGKEELAQGLLPGYESPEICHLGNNYI